MSKVCQKYSNVNPSSNTTPSKFQFKT